MIMNIRKDVVADDGYYSKKYVEPVVPEGYQHIKGTYWRTGFQIKRNKDGSLFTFIPVGSLKSNGILNGEQPSQKFGRRRWYPKEPDELGEESILGNQNPLWEQLQSVRKYGGFYVSSFHISRSVDMKLMSVRTWKALTRVNFNFAMDMAEKFENACSVSSHLLFGAEYDSILEWLVETKAMTIEEITENESSKNIKINNIYGLGSIGEWTQEKTINGTVSKHAVRGASIRSDGSKDPLAWREANFKYTRSDFIGFRVALYIP